MYWVSYWNAGGQSRGCVTGSENMLSELNDLVYWIEVVELKKKTGQQLTGCE